MKKVSNSIRRGLKAIDFYGEPVQMQFKLNSLFTSFCGALTSIVIYIVFFVILVYLFVDFNDKNNFFISQYMTKYEEPPLFNITTDEYIHIADRSQAYFFYAITIQDKRINKYITKEEIDRVLYIDAISARRNKSSGVTVILDTHEYVPCKDLYPSVDLAEKFSNEQVNYGLCSNITTNTLQGDFLNRFFSYTQMRITRCSENPFLKDKSVCSSTVEYENAKVNWIIDILYASYYINSDKHNQSPIEYGINKISCEFSKFIYQKFDVFLSRHLFTSNDDIYGEVTNVFKQSIVSINRVIKYESNPGKYIFAFFLRSDYEAYIYLRTYKTFTDLLSVFGGLWNVVCLIGAIIIVPYNAKVLNIAIANKLYNIVTEDKEKEVKIKYMTFVRSSLVSDQNQIIKFENKLPLECRLTINYYKYERNKGISFELKEFFFSICCFCCKSNKLKTKEALLSLCDNRLMGELQIKNVLEFAKQVQSLKIALMKEKQIMLALSSKNIIYSSNLNVINLQYELYSMLHKASPTSLALLKEKYLMNGLRAYKNKVGGLDKKIDLDLLSLFNFNQNLLAKYYPSQIHILKEKFKNIKVGCLAKADDFYDKDDTIDEKK